MTPDIVLLAAKHIKEIVDIDNQLKRLDIGDDKVTVYVNAMRREDKSLEEAATRALTDNLVARKNSLQVALVACGVTK